MARRKTQNPVTLQAIADEAGVSQTAVSLVLNRRGGELRIKPDTQQRILDIAQRRNYVQNHLARGLRGKRTNTIGVLWSLCGPHDSAGIPRGIAIHAQQHNYVTYLADSLSDPDVIPRALLDFAQRRVDGVIIQVIDADLMRAARIASLLDNFKASVVVSQQPLKTSCDFVHHNMDIARDQIIEHCLATGRRSLVFVAEGQANQSMLQRLQHTARALSSDSLSVQSIPLPLGTKLNPTIIWQTLDRAAADGVRFDAVMGTSDEIAAITFGWLCERGLRVPEDVTLFGCNDSTMAPFFTPPLASIARGHDELVRVVTELMFNRLDAPDSPPQHAEVKMRFVCRASAGPRKPPRK